MYNNVSQKENIHNISSIVPKLAQTRDTYGVSMLSHTRPDQPKNTTHTAHMSLSDSLIPVWRVYATDITHHLTSDPGAAQSMLRKVLYSKIRLWKIQIISLHSVICPSEIPCVPAMLFARPGCFCQQYCAQRASRGLARMSIRGPTQACSPFADLRKLAAAQCTAMRTDYFGVNQKCKLKGRVHRYGVFRRTHRFLEMACKYCSAFIGADAQLTEIQVHHGAGSHSIEI